MSIRAQRVLLESATRTASAACPQQKDVVARTVRLYLHVTAASGSGGLTFQLRGYDKASGTAVVLFADVSAITDTGTYVFEMAPSIGASDSHRRAVLLAFLPVVWDVNLSAGDSTSYTYSLSAELTS